MGVTPVHIPAVWKLKIPLGCMCFLWLLANNKLLARDNLSKRQKLEDMIYIFCKDNEIVARLFFDCVVVKEMWRNLSCITGIAVNAGLFDVFRLWICEKTHIVSNIVHAAALWSLWKQRNDLCFNRLSWPSMQVLFHRISLHLA
jgi:hypothetical protein